MGFAIDHDSPIPLNVQIGDAIQLAIARREVKAGDQLPTVRQLAVELKVNSNTVARVYAELERAGLLETKRGCGTFVRRFQENNGQRASARRLRSLVQGFVKTCLREGFSLYEIRHVFREIAAETIEKERP